MAPPSDDDQRPLPAIRFASDLPHLQRGESIMVTRDGSVMGKRAVRRNQILLFGALGAVCGGMIWFAPAFGITYTAILAALVGRKVARYRGLNHILRLMRDDRFDDAERAVSKLEAKRRGGAYDATCAWARAIMLCHKGELEGALAQSRRCSGLMPAPGPVYHVVYWQNLFIQAGLLLELGKLDEVRSVLTAIERAPAGEYFDVLHRELDALRAFVEQTPDALGDDDALHDRVRHALRYNHTGMTLALLGWAYEQRGDAEMATHCVREAPSRFLRGAELVEKMHPRVWAWLAPRLAAAAAADEDAP